jgi:hypothetical protein
MPLSIIIFRVHRFVVYQQPSLSSRRIFGHFLLVPSAGRAEQDINATYRNKGHGNKRHEYRFSAWDLG